MRKVTIQEFLDMWEKGCYIEQPVSVGKMIAARKNAHSDANDWNPTEIVYAEVP